MGKLGGMLRGMAGWLSRPARRGSKAPVDLGKEISDERTRTALLGGLLIGGAMIGGAGMYDAGNSGADSMPSNGGGMAG